MRIEGKNGVILKKEYMGRQDLKEVELLEGVTEIGSWAFAYCSNLTYVSLPQTVSSIGQDVFLKCDRLRRVHLAGNEKLAYVAAFSLGALATFEGKNNTLWKTDIGLWIENVDRELLSFVQLPDDDGFKPFLAGGEEDYEDVEEKREQFCFEKRIEKARYIIERMLISDEYLIENDTKQSLSKYLLECSDNSLGISPTLIVLSSEEERLIPYFDLLEREGVTRVIDVEKGLAQLGSEATELRALLLKKNTAFDAFSEFLL